jgi:prepilin peptidase CpaA
MNTQVGIALVVGVAAVVEDLARRRISNWTCLSALAGGLGWQIGQFGVGQGLWNGLGGAAAGFAVFLIFYLLGGMGGGDIKLMAGFGSLLGPGSLLEAAVLVAGIGGVLALGALGFAALRGQKDRPKALPYAPAIALGVWLALVAKK